MTGMVRPKYPLSIIELNGTKGFISFIRKIDMLFNSFEFLLFLPLIFGLYWLSIKVGTKFQNLVVVSGSYFFYAQWDYRFLILIVISTIIDFTCGICIHKSQNRNQRKLFLMMSLVGNLGMLGFFKYYNFFIENFISLLSVFHISTNLSTLNIILPVGISFYTFQTLSYTIDIYKGRIKPTQDFLAFAAFVSFFPQLLAGPIERARKLLPQFQSARSFSYKSSVDGLRQVLWGLFKKIVIADNVAQVVNLTFGLTDIFNGSALLIGAFLFSVQIYCDFSGYSDISIGTARLFGINLSQNFAYPLFSRNGMEYWNRWHITMTSWFKDYVYLPLSKYNKTPFLGAIVLFIYFIAIGLWHGASWNFVIFGALNALYILILQGMGIKTSFKNIIAHGKIFPNLKEWGQLISFHLSTILFLIFFRAEDFYGSLNYLNSMFSLSLFEVPNFQNLKKIVNIFALLTVFFTIEWFGRYDKFAIESIGKLKSATGRILFYYGLVFVILYFSGQKQEFIYFQF
jgi:alginate O-acetyltransferase complex protein AlgI